MRKLVCVLIFSGALLAQDAPGSITPGSIPNNPLNKGIEAYHAGRYGEAEQLFQQAVYADTSNLTAHLYLATTIYQQFIPGVQTPENDQFAERARHAFELVLSLDATNQTAVASLASLAYNQKNFEDAKIWNHRLIALNPKSKEAYYTLGVIAWAQALTEFREARLQSGMKPEDPGPISDAKLRAQLRAAHWQPFEDAIFNLNKALEIDPKYDDAMAYLNLMYRFRADMQDTPEQAAADVARANELMLRALETKKAATLGEQGIIGGSRVESDPRPAPLSPDATAVPVPLRIGENVAAAGLIQKVDPEYPPQALEARISGTVRFNVTIGVDGTVKDCTLISGHPLMVQAARSALSNYRYKPTVLNGEPVPVRTTVGVVFTLPPT